MSKLMNETKVLLTDVRLSYAYLFEPQEMSKKYSTAILIPKDDEESIAIVKQAIKNARDIGKDTKWKGQIPKELKLPLRDGDKDRPDRPEYEGMYFFNANSKNPPEVVGLYKNPETGKPVKLGENEVYSGCYVNVTINFFPFDTQGNRGIGAGLGNVQKIRDGKRFGGNASAAEDFDFEDSTFDFEDSTFDFEDSTFDFEDSTFDFEEAESEDDDWLS